MDGKDTTNFGRVISLLNENIAELQAQLTATSVGKTQLVEEGNSLRKVIGAALEHEDMTADLKSYIRNMLEAKGCLSASKE